MKRFILKISILFAFLIAINIYVSQTVTIGNLFSDYLAPKEQVNNNTSKILLLGDSHPLSLLQEYLGDTIFNFSYHTEAYSDMYIKLMYYLKNGNIPEKVIVPVDYHCFTTYRYWSNNRRTSILYSDYDAYNKVYSIPRHRYFYNLLAVHLPMLDSKNSELLGRFYKGKRKSLLHYIRTGEHKEFGEWVPPNWMDVNKEKQLVNAQQRIQGQFPNSWDGRLANYLLEIKNICDSLNIQLIGIKFPVTKVYYDLLHEKDLHRTNEFLKSLNMEVLDYQTLYFGRDELFRDQDHLNKERGGKVFAKHLIRELLNPKKSEALTSLSYP